MNCRTLLLLLLFSVFSLFSNAQEGQEFLVCNHSDTTDSHVNTNLIESYKITVDMKADQREIPSKIYLYAYKMGELALVDSAKVKGKRRFFEKNRISLGRIQNFCSQAFIKSALPARIILLFSTAFLK